MVERQTPPTCCVLEQDTLLPKSTGNTQEVVAPSRHDLDLRQGKTVKDPDLCFSFFTTQKAGFLAFRLNLYITLTKILIKGFECLKTTDSLVCYFIYSNYGASTNRNQFSGPAQTLTVTGKRMSTEYW